MIALLGLYVSILKTRTFQFLVPKGNGKKSLLDDYRVTNRGGKGVKTINITDKTGQLVAIKSVHDTDDLMITTTNGVMIRMALDTLRIMGRATQGVRLIRLDEGDNIGDVAVVKRDEDDPKADQFEIIEGEIEDSEE